MENNQVENLNEVKLKKVITNFERRLNDNQRSRIKYEGEPSKFASSETELFAALDELQSVATQPELYHVLVSKRVLPNLFSLIGHENTDISAKVIGLLQELTDVDEVNMQDSTDELLKIVQDKTVIDLIVNNLDRLDESVKDESQAINNSLAIIDNLVDFDLSFAATDFRSLIKWMMKQYRKTPEYNSIKLSISEVLSILLINSRENKLHLNESSGIDALLQQVAHYRRIAPVTGDEHEFLEQTINCLCTAVLDCDENREAFFDEEGVDLVELILREKRSAVKKSNIKVSTLKLFNHVLTTDKNRDPVVTKCCERFIQVLGLRVIFPIFNNPKVIISEKIRKREYYQVLDEIEEHTSAIILALLKYCQDTELIQRILVKFAESEFEKMNRLLDLHKKYFKIVTARRQTESRKLRSETDSYDADIEEDSKSSVHFTLRTIDYIIMLTCYLSNHFETYDPNSGEIFISRIGKMLAHKQMFELRDQIITEVERHIDELGDSSPEEQNSLELLLKYFKQLTFGDSGYNIDGRDNKKAKEAKSDIVTHEI